MKFGPSDITIVVWCWFTIVFVDKKESRKKNFVVRLCWRIYLVLTNTDQILRFELTLWILVVQYWNQDQDWVYLIINSIEMISLITYDANVIIKNFLGQSAKKWTHQANLQFWPIGQSGGKARLFQECLVSLKRLPLCGHFWTNWPQLFARES